MNRFEKTIVINEESVAVDAIASLSGLSKSTVKKLMTLGAVWIKRKGKLARFRSHKKTLQAGTEVKIYYDEKILNYKAAEEPSLLYSEKGFDVWFKPSGWVAQGTQYGDKYSILRATEKKHGKSFLVHRLDREVSGVMLVATTKEAAAHFSKTWHQSSTKKIYQAIVKGSIDRAVPFDIDYEIDGKEAKTIVTKTLPGKEEDQTLVELEIKTGRKHQIRLHLCDIDHPIMGDPSYGEYNKNDDGLKLIAKSLTIKTPKGELKTFAVPEESLFIREITENGSSNDK